MCGQLPDRQEGVSFTSSNVINGTAQTLQPLAVHGEPGQFALPDGGYVLSPSK